MDINKTLYISDLDGTLLNQSAKLSQYTINTLNSLIAKGLNFSVASARLLEPVQNMLADVNINVPIVLMNGVLIYDIKQEQYIKVNKLLPETITLVIQTIKKYEIVGFMYELNNKQVKTYHETFGQNPLHDYLKDRIVRYKSIMPANGLSDVPPENVIYFTLIDSYERLKPVHDYLATQCELNQTLYKNVYNPNFWFLEIYSTESSKQSALDYIRKTYGFKQIIGFGDNHNDLPMFAACDVRVAVENATEDVKSIADFVCESNVNDGVAKWMKTHYTAN